MSYRVSLLSFQVPYQAIFIIAPLIAAGMVLAGAAAVVLIAKQGQARDAGPQAYTGRWTKLRHVLLGLFFWLALSAYLVLDFALTVSVYVQFVVIYVAVVALLGALLLLGRPTRYALAILALFCILAFSVRFLDWNSRKPFLRDLFRIRQGMTPAQVDQIMAGYMRCTHGGPPGAGCAFSASGEIVRGFVTYRHTLEWWGNSDWGTVAFEDGRVAYVRFYPD